jgi:hypothetical protein
MNQGLRGKTGKYMSAEGEPLFFSQHMVPKKQQLVPEGQQPSLQQTG